MKTDDQINITFTPTQVGIAAVETVNKLTFGAEITLQLVTDDDRGYLAYNADGDIILRWHPDGSVTAARPDRKL